MRQVRVPVRKSYSSKKASWSDRYSPTFTNIYDSFFQLTPYYDFKKLLEEWSLKEGLKKGKRNTECKRRSWDEQKIPDYCFAFPFVLIYSSFIRINSLILSDTCVDFYDFIYNWIGVISLPMIASSSLLWCHRSNQRCTATTAVFRKHQVELYERRN